MIGERFELSPPKRLVPETSALDHSAIQPKAWAFMFSLVLIDLRISKREGPTGIWTRIEGFKVLSDDRYTIGPNPAEPSAFQFKWKVLVDLNIVMCWVEACVPLELRWQSGRPLTDRSLVRSQAGA